MVDGTILNEVIIPTTNVDRNLPDGSTDPDEVVNQSQVYITTAGWKNSFAYDKLVEILINSVLFPDRYMILGGDYELSIIEGAVKEDMVDQMRLNGTYNENSFEREYGSVWSGDAENAYFSGDIFEKYRTLRQAEGEWSGRSSRNAYYILGVDVGRFGCTTEVMVIKVTPQVQGSAQKTLVNLFTYDAEHFEIQAIYIKKLFNLYKCRKAVIDGNGLGAGLIDFMVKSQVDPETGEYYPPFGIDNDDEGIYKKFKTADCVKDAIYIVKANAPINSEAHTYLQTQMSSGKIHFLIDEKEAKAKLLETKVGQNMTPDQRNEYLRPYQLTTILKEQLLNLVEDNDGINIILKQNNRGIKKDKFSALEYGLYYIKKEEARKKKRSGIGDLSKLMLMS